MKDLKEAGKNNIRGSASLGSRYFRFNNHKTSNGSNLLFVLRMHKKTSSYSFTAMVSKSATVINVQAAGYITLTVSADFGFIPLF